MITLETERLKMRMFRDEDLDSYAEICADPEVMRFLGGKPLSRADAWHQMAITIRQSAWPSVWERSSKAKPRSLEFKSEFMASASRGAA